MLDRMLKLTDKKYKDTSIGKKLKKTLKQMKLISSCDVC